MRLPLYSLPSCIGKYVIVVHYKLLLETLNIDYIPQETAFPLFI